MKCRIHDLRPGKVSIRGKGKQAKLVAEFRCEKCKASFKQVLYANADEQLDVRLARLEEALDGDV